jgi:hypothetical protein
MSASQFDEFDRRMRRINRRHTQLSQGYVTSINGDGLVVAKPKRKMRRGTLRSLAILVIMMMIFKAVLHANLGAAEYDARVASFANGSVFEKVGAWVMVSDPLTEMMSVRIARYL